MWRNFVSICELLHASLAKMSYQEQTYNYQRRPTFFTLNVLYFKSERTWFTICQRPKASVSELPRLVMIKRSIEAPPGPHDLFLYTESLIRGGIVRTNFRPQISA